MVLNIIKYVHPFRTLEKDIFQLMQQNRPMAGFLILRHTMVPLSCVASWYYLPLKLSKIKTSFPYYTMRKAQVSSKYMINGFLRFTFCFKEKRICPFHEGLAAQLKTPCCWTHQTFSTLIPWPNLICIKLHRKPHSSTSFCRVWGTESLT